jgi:hypothetical protein
VLGEGAFGRAYRAHDPTLDREVALKVPRFGPEQAPLLERFLREARAAARLRHPGIVAVFEVGQADGRPFIVSELVQGRSLAELLREERPSLRRAAEWARSLALALHYAHEQGVVHRDVKPSNVMVDRHGRAQLMDFGLAKLLDRTDLDRAALPLADEGTLATAEGTLLGTPAYMAPEQARGEVEAVGPLSDQYALGVVLFEMLTGQRPFTGPAGRLREQVADPNLPAPSPRKLRPEVPLDLAAICLKALAKEPIRRYRDLSELAVDLQRWLNGQPVRARRRARLALPAWPGRLLAWSRRSSLRLLLVGALLVALVGGAFGLVVLVGRMRDADRGRDQALREAEQAREEAQRKADEARREGLRRDSDIALERGQRLRGQGKAAEGLVWLARSYGLAVEVEDEPRQQAAAGALAEGEALPPSPGLEGDARRRWALAGNLLLGVPLPAAEGWEALGRRLPHVGAARLTAFGAGGKVVLSADEPTREQVPGPRGQSTVRYGPLQFRDAATGKALGPSLLGEGQVSFSPDGRRAIHADAVWVVWDLAAGKELGPKHQRDWRSDAVAFSDDGGHFAVARQGRWGSAVFRSEGLKQVWRPEVSEYGGRPQSLALSRDGRALAVLSHNSATLLAADEPKPVRVGDRPVLAVAFHPDGRRLAVAAKDAVELWDRSRRLGPFLPAPGVTRIVFSPDGRQVLTLSAGQARLWDVTRRRPVGLPLETVERVGRAQFRPDGRAILTAADGDARLWPNPVVAAAERGRAAQRWAEATAGLEVHEGAVRPLSAAERAERRLQFERLAGLAPAE